MKEINLSEKEQKLYNVIKNTEFDVTIKIIEEQLGKEYIGALGKLLHLGLIRSEKRKIKVPINELANQYLQKWIKCYFVKEGE